MRKWENKAREDTSIRDLSSIVQQRNLVLSTLSILTRPHQWHPHVKHCASWLGGTPLFLSCHPAEHVCNERPGGTGKHSWSHLLGRDERRKWVIYTHKYMLIYIVYTHIDSHLPHCIMDLKRKSHAGPMPWTMKTRWSTFSGSPGNTHRNISPKVSTIGNAL